MRFFKNFRMNEIIKKNLFNYLKYSFGEIILVTIGILLAVKINNLNNDRLTHVLEKELIKELYGELQFNIDRIILIDELGGPYPMAVSDSVFDEKLKLIDK